MSNQQSPLTVGEFTRWSDRTDRTLERIDNKTDDHGHRLTVLETRLASQAKVEVKATRKTASGWSAGIAGVIVLVMEILHRVAAAK